MRDDHKSETVLERLTALYPKKIDLSLDRLERLLAAIDHPHLSLPPVFHIAGTNGKGSVAAFLASILTASGSSVHVYTSPHLVFFHERIALWNGKEPQLISEDLLYELLLECEAANDGQEITFFEITTAVALLAFVRHPVDAIILETGLGGRYDATNVIPTPAATLLTQIGMDHEDYLGDRLDLIAHQKAGIIKPKVPCFLARQESIVRAVIHETAKTVGAPLLTLGQDFDVYTDRGYLIYQDETRFLELDQPQLPGHHQIENAGLALAAMLHAGPQDIQTDALNTGLANAHWPGRLQKLPARTFPEFKGLKVPIWLDGGHNPSAGRAVAEYWRSKLNTNTRLHMIIAIMSRKDLIGYLTPFASLLASVTCVGLSRTTDFRDPNVAAKSVKALKGFEMCRISTALSYRDALSDFTRQIETTSVPNCQDHLLIAGSLYLVGEVLADLKEYTTPSAIFE